MTTTYEYNELVRYTRTYNYKHAEGFCDKTEELEITSENLANIKKVAVVLAREANVKVEVAEQALVNWCVLKHLREQQS